MKRLSFLLFLLLLFFVGRCFSQPYALLLRKETLTKWDTVCIFTHNDLEITNPGEIEFRNLPCLPVAYSGLCILYFLFPDETYFLIETQTVYTNTGCKYPCIFVNRDSIRQKKYEVNIPHPQDSLCWKYFVEKWNGRSINPLLPEKPYLEIGPSCIVYAGKTCNLYDDCHRKHGKWIVYTINNFFRKDSTSFLLPFDVDVLAEQYFENGKKVGSWTGFYHGGEKCFTCVFSNDSLVKGVFFKEDGRIRYKYMHMKNGMFVFKDFTDKRKKINITQEELSVWLRLLT